MKLLDPRGTPKHPVFSLLWRILLLAPIFWTAGLVLLLAAFAAMIAPPIYAVICVLGGSYIQAILVITGWCIFLPFGHRLLGWLLQGIEYS